MCVHVCPCMCVCVHVHVFVQPMEALYTYKRLWDCIGTHIMPLLIHWDAVYGITVCDCMSVLCVQILLYSGRHDVPAVLHATLVNIQSHSEYRLKEATDPNTIEQA